MFYLFVTYCVTFAFWALGLEFHAIVWAFFISNGLYLCVHNDFSAIRNLFVFNQQDDHYKKITYKRHWSRFSVTKSYWILFLWISTEQQRKITSQENGEYLLYWVLCGQFILWTRILLSFDILLMLIIMNNALFKKGGIFSFNFSTLKREMLLKRSFSLKFVKNFIFYTSWAVMVVSFVSVHKMKRWKRKKKQPYLSNVSTWKP